MNSWANQGDLFSFYEICQGYFWTTENDKVDSFLISWLLEEEFCRLSMSSGSRLKCFFF